ncbi:unnamed protein product [Coccothraustes coccothraustes]
MTPVLGGLRAMDNDLGLDHHGLGAFGGLYLCLWVSPWEVWLLVGWTPSAWGAVGPPFLGSLSHSHKRPLRLCAPG